MEGEDEVGYSPETKTKNLTSLTFSNYRSIEYSATVKGSASPDEYFLMTIELNQYGLNMGIWFLNFQAAL
jgi:hypothetical protein